jgi:D-3-phosphoglycerate dehydrogenase
MAPTCLIATEKPFAPKAREAMVNMMKGAGLEVALLEDYKGKEALKEALAKADGVIIRSDKIDAGVLEGSNCKIVVRAGAGTDNVSNEVKAKLIVENTPGQNSQAVAELAFGMMIMMARVKYSGKAGTELRGKKLGLQAFGCVAQRMAVIAKGFEMDVVAFDPFMTKEQIEAKGVKHADKVETLYTECDYVSLHIPCTPQTKGSVNYALVSQMKADACLINTARAEVVNEEDLLKIFAEKKGFKYCCDVQPKDPKPFQEKFDDRFYMTPKKLGAQTAEANSNAGLAAAEQIVAFLIHNQIKYRVMD